MYVFIYIIYIYYEYITYYIYVFINISIGCSNVANYCIIFKITIAFHNQLTVYKKLSEVATSRILPPTLQTLRGGVLEDSTLGTPQNQRGVLEDVPEDPNSRREIPKNPTSMSAESSRTLALWGLRISQSLILENSTKPKSKSCTFDIGFFGFGLLKVESLWTPQSQSWSLQDVLEVSTSASYLANGYEC